ncbi:MAG: helix-turn-helix transcriptional regulator, partial [Myxococcales bacterium]|nr:helix-turn-helix transcriptional regulator [Myxococcales bacterium]
MNQPTIPEIHETLKRLLRRRRITYRQLGSRIGMSESGVKKLLGGEDLSMVRLLEICEVLDLEVDELLRVAREGPAEARELDEATKRRLAKHPRDLWFLWALMERGGDVEALRRAIGMDARSARRILARLDAGGFVRIGQDGSLGRLSV